MIKSDIYHKNDLAMYIKILVVIKTFIFDS